MLRRIRMIATTPSRMPTTIEPTASHIASPVSWWRETPAAATASPIRAAKSSAKTERSNGLDVTER